MKPINFKQKNATYAEHQPEYLNLPVYKNGDGNVISCWKCGLMERLMVLLTGRVFISCMTFNNPLQPQRLGVRFKDVG